MLKNSKNNSKNNNLGFGFNKRPLNLNNSCIKSNQFCKLLNQIIEMMLIDYPHSKSTHNFKVVKFKILKIKNLLNKIFKFQESFITCKCGVMYMTSKTKL